MSMEQRKRLRVTYEAAVGLGRKLSGSPLKRQADGIVLALKKLLEDVEAA